jgi:hypothetical protein
MRGHEDRPQDKRIAKQIQRITDCPITGELLYVLNERLSTMVSLVISSVQCLKAMDQLSLTGGFEPCADPSPLALAP